MNMKKYFEQGILTLLENKKIDDITVGEIIEEVGSCKGTFYKHYIDKYSLCCASLQNNIYSAISTEPDNLGRFVKDCIAAFRKNAKVILHAFQSSDINSPRSHHEKFTSDFLIALYKKNGGDMNSELNLTAINLYSATITDILVKWMAAGGEQSDDEVYNLICAVIPHTVTDKLLCCA